MRKALRCIAILALLVMQLQGIFTLNTADVKAQDETVILNNDAAKVTVSPVVTDTAIEWTISYAKTAPTDAVARAIRFKLATAADGSGTVQRKDGDLKEKATGDEWFRESPATTTYTEGKLVVTTSKDTKQLVIWTQVDQVNAMGQATQELLSETDATAKTVAAPVIPEAEQEDEIVVDQTPVDTTDPAESLPETPAQTETEEKTSVVTENEIKQPETDVNEEKSKTDSDQEDPNLPGEPATIKATAPRAATFSRNILRIGNSSSDDIFGYENDDAGKYPTHNTESYVGGGSSTNISNYNYATKDSNSKAPTVASILNTQNAFDNGYHQYQGGSGTTQFNVYTKKSVSPIAGSSNQFKVQLDMIGDAIRPIPNVDVVLVLDKSSSMNDKETGHDKTKWAELKDAVKSFSDGVLSADNNVHIGMTSFGTANQEAWGEIAKWNGVGFTDSAASVQSHSLYTANPGSNSGTPTAFGTDLGLYLLGQTSLGARSNAAKIIITITDGDPTYYPNDNYYSGLNVNESISSRTTLENNTNSLSHYVAKVGRTTYFTRGDDGNSTTTVKNRTITFFNTRLAQTEVKSYSKYAIGFGSGVTSNEVMKANGPDGQYTADNIAGLITAMNSIIGEHTSQIVNATLSDPMSKYVTLDTSTVDISALTLENKSLTVIRKGESAYPGYASSINQTLSSTGILLEGINLGGTTTKQYGLRVEYTVTLKDDYRDGLFYPTNETTTLQNNHQNEYLHFAVPSVRDTQNMGSIVVSKVWNDQNNKFDTRSDVNFRVERRASGATNWSTYGSPKTLDKGSTSVTFNNLPIAGGSTNYFYRVVEYVGENQAFVSGYENPNYSINQETGIRLTHGDSAAITVTNKLKYTNYAFTKENGKGDELVGAEFSVTRAGTSGTFATLTSEGGKFNLTGLPIGVYTVTETKTPDGYAGGKSFTVTVTDDTSKPNALKYTVEGITNDIVVNTLKDFTLALVKTNEDMAFLSGAKFHISGNGIDVTGTTNRFGQLEELADVKFKPGTYTIEELAAPYGYDQFEGTFELVIADDGSVTLSYSDDDLTENTDYKLTSELTTNETEVNKISLSMKNRETKNVPLPSTGSSGIGAFIVIGILLLGTAGYLKLVDWRKKRGGDGNA